MSRWFYGGGIFGWGRLAPGEIGCFGAIVWSILFAAAMLGMVALVASQTGIQL